MSRPGVVGAVSVSASKSSLAALTLGALGVVYGDIGTSVLYALKVVFTEGGIPLTPDNIYGILSLVFWLVTVVVSLKYVTLILRADNKGEGGLIAMLALASNAVSDRPRLRRVVLFIGICGTAIFYGDGVITPAISVLSAVEGLELISPALKRYVMPLSLVIIFCLFWVQKKGTTGIGKFFGPICAVWFVVIGVLGVPHILAHPEVLGALSPHHALRFILQQPGTTFVLLGALVLCVTGVEALYADMGHFGKQPIRLAWFTLVMPALLLNYFGQGAMLLYTPEHVSNPFYLMAPDWALIPLVILATAATVIASQALLSAAFSVTKQAIQLGYFPRMVIRHTSVRETGQIYIPAVNWSLFVAIVVAVALFKTSSNLASAYGIAVTTDMLITTVLTFFVIRYAWKLPLLLCIAATGIFFVIDLMLFASNTLKFFHGGWFPVLIGVAMFTVMMTWKEGPQAVERKGAGRCAGPAEFSGGGVHQPAGAGRRHGRVPDQRPRHRAQRAAAQPQTQQGAARAQPVRHGEKPRGAMDRAGQAAGDRVVGARLLAGQHPLRFQERPRRAPRTGADPRAWLRVRADEHQLLPVARPGGAQHRARHDDVARKNSLRKCTTTPAARPTS